MPTYEYRCPEGHDFERFFRKISDAAPEQSCPVCGKIATRKISASGLVFKGSGFYLTDYGKNAHRGAAPSSESKSDSGGESKTEKPSGGDAKPEAKAAESKPAESKPVEKKAEKPAESKKTPKSGD